jgi:hypothetical protein
MLWRQWYCRHDNIHIHHSHMNKRFLHGLIPLLLVTFACEPMIAIGKYEFLILVVLVAVLLGPPVYRFIRKVEQILKKDK